MYRVFISETEQLDSSGLIKTMQLIVTKPNIFMELYHIY